MMLRQSLSSNLARPFSRASSRSLSRLRSRLVSLFTHFCHLVGLKLSQSATMRSLEHARRKKSFHPSRWAPKYFFLVLVPFLAILHLLPSLSPFMSALSSTNGRSLAPLPTLYSPVAASLPHSTSQHITAHIVCHYSTPCCHATITLALRALLHQSLLPTSISVVHSCTTKPQLAMMRAAIADTFTSESPSGLSLILKSCAEADSNGLYDLCILRHLHVTASLRTSLTFVLCSHQVFEPTALESSWLALQVQPELSSVTLVSFSEPSVRSAAVVDDPTPVMAELPSSNSSQTQLFSPCPFLAFSTKFSMLRKNMDTVALSDLADDLWVSLFNVLSSGRLLRHPLYTEVSISNSHADLIIDPMLSFGHAPFPKRAIPPQLLSYTSYYKWSARHEEEKLYSTPFALPDLKNASHLPLYDLSHSKKPSIAILMPSLQMGPSEVAILDFAESVVSKGHFVTIILTSPEWHEDDSGEVAQHQPLLTRALSLTADVFNLAALSPFHMATRSLRYILKSRKPNYVLISHTPWSYAHAPLIRIVVPEGVLAGYSHANYVGLSDMDISRDHSHYWEVFDVMLETSPNLESIKPNRKDEGQVKDILMCDVGTDPSLFHSGTNREAVRAAVRSKLGVKVDTLVVLVLERFVLDGEKDIFSGILPGVSSDARLSSTVQFLFVDEFKETSTFQHVAVNYSSSVHTMPGTRSFSDLRDYYAASDVIIIPTNAKTAGAWPGVVQQAMAAEVWVITTEPASDGIVTEDTGLILREPDDASQMTSVIVKMLRDMVMGPAKYDQLRAAAAYSIRRQFDPHEFSRCVLRALVQTSRTKDESDAAKPSWRNIVFSQHQQMLIKDLEKQRKEAVHRRADVVRKDKNLITIGIKTYVCDSQTVRLVRSLLRSIRLNYPDVRVLLGNDGPTRLADEDFVRNDANTEELDLGDDAGISVGRNAMVNASTTKFFVLLDDDHLVDETTDLRRLADSLEEWKLDMVGMRIRNLPGIEELERLGISVPRYVSTYVSFADRTLVLCTWNENEGPGVHKMREPFHVHVLHNAFVARTDVLRAHPWRDELVVNEHMTFFLDAWRANLRVGYLPSEFVHHRPRRYSKCYYAKRFREESYAKLLDYKDVLFYDTHCGAKFPSRVRDHIKTEKQRRQEAMKSI